MGFDRDQVQADLRALAERGVYLGTSSWRYPGWLGQLYSAERYLYRGKVAKSRFEANCLAEFAEVIPTVCVDAAYYAFPTESHLEGLASQTPDGFRFSFKVTDAITVKTFPAHPRFGTKAGLRNPDFLNPDLFSTQFLKPMASIRGKVGLLIFEFSRFYAYDYNRGADFLDDLDRFLGALPGGWHFGIELRNRNWLTPAYFGCLARHSVTHVFNSWTAMPTVAEQMAVPESRTTPNLIAARFLLKPGRTFEAAVKEFQPYDRTREVYEEARTAAADLIVETGQKPAKGAYLYVGNRLEGNSLNSIAAVIEKLKARKAMPQADVRPTAKRGREGGSKSAEDLFSGEKGRLL